MMRLPGRVKIPHATRAVSLSYLSPVEEMVAKPFPIAALTPAIVNYSKLEGGVNIVTKDTYAPTATLKFALLGGSSTEASAQKGAAQLLSATAFAGNKKNSGLRIVRFLESLGAEFSASADREKVSYDVRVLQDRVEPVIAAIVSAISSPPHAAYVMEESRKNALLRFEKSYSDPSFAFNELLHEVAFGEGSAYGSPLFGTDLKKLAAEDVMSYRNAHFVQENLVVAASGISHDRLKSLLQLHVKRIPSATSSIPAIPDFSYQGGELRVKDRNDGKTELALAFPFSAGSPGKAAKVLASFLNSSFNEKKICAEAFTISYSCGGLFGVRVMGPVAAANTNLEAAIKELKDIAHAGDISLAKKKVHLDAVVGLDSRSSTSILLDAYIQQASVSEIFTFEKLNDGDVKSTAASMLKSMPSYLVHGTTAGTPSYSSIKKSLA